MRSVRHRGDVVTAAEAAGETRVTARARLTEQINAELRRLDARIDDLIDLAHARRDDAFRAEDHRARTYWAGIQNRLVAQRGALCARAVDECDLRLLTGSLDDLEKALNRPVPEPTPPPRPPRRVRIPLPQPAPVPVAATPARQSRKRAAKTPATTGVTSSVSSRPNSEGSPARPPAGAEAGDDEESDSDRVAAREAADVARSGCGS